MAKEARPVYAPGTKPDVVGQQVRNTVQRERFQRAAPRKKSYTMTKSTDMWAGKGAQGDSMKTMKTATCVSGENEGTQHYKKQTGRQIGL